MNKILQEIIDIVERNLLISREKITPHARFIEDLGADSLDIVEMAMEIEDKYSITIRDEDEKSLRSVETVIQLIVHKQNV